MDKKNQQGFAPILIVVIIVVAAATIGGYMFLKSNKSSMVPAAVQPPSSSQSSGGGVFSSIQDALSKSLSLQCNFTDNQGRKTVSYIKNGAVRGDVTGTTAQDSGSVIMKDNKIWFWNAQGGFTMDLSTTNQGSNGQQNQGQTERQNLMNSLEKYKDNCKPAVVDDSLFTPPASVKFQDMSQMMKAIPTMPPGSGGIQQQMR